MVCVFVNKAKTDDQPALAANFFRKGFSIKANREVQNVLQLDVIFTVT